MDDFSLYDLDVSVAGDPSTFACSHAVGHAFTVIGENLIFSDNNKQFSMYALASLLPLLPAKQRPTHENDWMTTDHYIHCPDPNCGAQFKINRISKTTFQHSKVTKVPLKKEDK